MQSLTIKGETPVDPTTATAPQGDVTTRGETTRVTISTEAKPAEAPAKKLFAGKYESVEALEAAYTEAQKVISKGKPAEAPKAPEGQPAETPKTPEATEENPLVIAGRQALANQFVQDVTGAVGGAEQFAQLQQWGAANMTPAEVEAFDTAMKSGNPALAKLAAVGLKAQYDAKVGVEPNLVGTENVPDSAGVKPFRSQSEVLAAMSDPRYKNHDAAYHAEVQARMAKSNLW